MANNYNQQKSVIHEACKNFSLLDKEGIGYTLSPAYDLLAVALTGIADKDELAMPLTGYGVDDNQYIAGFDRSSFLEAMAISDIDFKIGNKLINRLTKNVSIRRTTRFTSCSYVASLHQQ